MGGICTPCYWHFATAKIIDMINACKIILTLLKISASILAFGVLFVFGVLGRKNEKLVNISSDIRRSSNEFKLSLLKRVPTLPK